MILRNKELYVQKLDTQQRSAADVSLRCTTIWSLETAKSEPLVLKPSPGAQAGMTSINDFATTYMCQSLPFGGVKESGFDRFAGIEGLRGLCVPKAVAEDRCERERGVGRWRLVIDTCAPRAVMQPPRSGVKSGMVASSR